MQREIPRLVRIGRGQTLMPSSVDGRVVYAQLCSVQIRHTDTNAVDCVSKGQGGRAGIVLIVVGVALVMIKFDERWFPRTSLNFQHHLQFWHELRSAWMAI